MNWSLCSAMMKSFLMRCCYCLVKVKPWSNYCQQVHVGTIKHGAFKILSDLLLLKCFIQWGWFHGFRKSLSLQMCAGHRDRCCHHGLPLLLAPYGLFHPGMYSVALQSWTEPLQMDIILNRPSELLPIYRRVNNTAPPPPPPTPKSWQICQ